MVAEDLNSFPTQNVGTTELVILDLPQLFNHEPESSCAVYL